MIGPINGKHLDAVRHNVLPWKDGRWLLTLRMGIPRLFDPKTGELTEFPVPLSDGAIPSYPSFQQIIRTVKGSLLAMGESLQFSALVAVLLAAYVWRGSGPLSYDAWAAAHPVAQPAGEDEWHPHPSQTDLHV